MKEASPSPMVRPETLRVTVAPKISVHQDHPEMAQQVTVSEHGVQSTSTYPKPIEVRPIIIEHTEVPQFAQAEVHPQEVSAHTVALEAICEEGEESNVFGAHHHQSPADKQVTLKLTPSERRKKKLADISRQRAESSRQPAVIRHPAASQKQQDAALVLRCTQCNRQLESFDEDTLCLSVICLSTFVHREPSMAAPLLPSILQTTARVADHIFHPWQGESSVFAPGNCRSVAKQLLRVVLHQLSNSSIALQLFQTQIDDAQTFWKTVNVALLDFPELTPIAMLHILLEDVNSNWPYRFGRILYNFAAYISHAPTDVYLTTWSNVVTSLDVFYRRYLAELQTVNDHSHIKAELNCSIAVMNVVLKVQNFASFKSSSALIESFSKWLDYVIQSTPIKLVDLLTIATGCTRAFVRERDKLCLSRACVTELVQAIKFKSTLPEENYLVLLHFILQDVGEIVNPDLEDLYNTGAADCARPFITEFVDFIADLHVLNKVKNLGGRGSGFREDTLGGDLKAGFAQYISVEISRGSVRDPRTVLRYLPWLLTSPSVTQQSPTEFVDSVTHVRVLSWVLLGALQSTSVACLPIPIESSQHIADQIQFVLASFAEQSKESVVHMSALFHAFHLCQLWTVYCEQAACANPGSELGTQAMANVMDFWARVTPAVLQLLSHSKVLADMVNLHFLNTIQALQECQSAVLCQLYPMWQPILTAYHTQIPGHLRMKLDSCENDLKLDDVGLGVWLKRVRFKISQVELQTSAAANLQPFYNV